jgi:hypothetical protein
MTTRSVSEDLRATRNEMAHASVEIARLLIDVAARLDGVPRSAALPDRLRQLGEFVDGFGKQAASTTEESLAELSWIYVDVAVALGELGQLAVELEHEKSPIAISIAINQAATKIARLVDIIAQASKLVEQGGAADE